MLKELSLGLEGKTPPVAAAMILTSNATAAAPDGEKVEELAEEQKGHAEYNKIIN